MQDKLKTCAINDIAALTIYRGTHQIGGCCTETTAGGERILIDLGANLPDSDAPIQDDELVAKVFDDRPAAGLLFTHPHGDHYGLLDHIPVQPRHFQGLCGIERAGNANTCGPSVFAIPINF